RSPAVAGAGWVAPVLRRFERLPTPESVPEERNDHVSHDSDPPDRPAVRAGSSGNPVRPGPRHAQGSEGRPAAGGAVGGGPGGVSEHEDPRVAAADRPQTLARSRSGEDPCHAAETPGRDAGTPRPGEGQGAFER